MRQFCLRIAALSFLLCISGWLSGCTHSATGEQLAPEPQSGWIDKPIVHAAHFAVSSAHPLATEAGLKVLRAGGNAIDAAIAVQMTLGLVEPQSSGIGGGGFLLYYDATEKSLHNYDGRETAPARISPSLFLDKQGVPLPFLDAVTGGRSVGVPGLLHLLHRAHREHGTLPWKQLFEDAIQLAEKGFITPQRLHAVRNYAKHLYAIPSFQELYLQGDNHPGASHFRNPALATTLRQIATEGIAPFYTGHIASDIADSVQRSHVNPGSLTLDDLKHYRTRRRPSLCGNYRGYRVCSMAPPSSGGIAIVQTLGILEQFPLHSMPPYHPEAIHLIMESLRLAYADRNQYVADPDFVHVPIAALLDRQYLAARAQLIDPEQAMQQVTPGTVIQHGIAQLTPPAYEAPSTTHFSIIDAQGNAVSMTSSIEHAFGSGLVVNGFLLNNQLTDFAFLPEHNDLPVANRAEPRKRPRSSMAPTIIFSPDGRLLGVIGSPGGARIIPYVVKTLICLLDWKMDIQQAIDAPNIAHLGEIAELESGHGLEALGQALKEKGHSVKFSDLNSGLHGIIAAAPGRLSGGADPRRDGIASGE